MNVLSTTMIMPFSCASFASAVRSDTSRFGFVGVSTKSIFVFGRMAAFTASRSDVCTRSNDRPWRSRIRLKSRYVPP